MKYIYIYTDKSLVVRNPLHLVNNGECHQSVIYANIEHNYLKRLLELTIIHMEAERSGYNVRTTDLVLLIGIPVL